jgi:hypothetical protein
MNAPINSTIARNGPGIPIPAFLEAIARPVSLLPGEDPKQLQVIRDAIIDEIAPRSGIEWLWTFDVIDLSWDVQRYRALRHKVLEAHRQSAIERALQRLDLAGISFESLKAARDHIKRNAVQWREDPDAAAEIEGRLASNGIDAGAINLEVFVQSKEIFLIFDVLINSAQRRRASSLREINNRRASTTTYRNTREQEHP